MEISPETIKFIVTLGLSAIALIGIGKFILDRSFPSNKTKYKNKPMGRDPRTKDLTPRPKQPGRH